MFMSWNICFSAVDRSVRRTKYVIANTLHRSRRKSTPFSLWISEARASQERTPLTKILFFDFTTCSNWDSNHRLSFVNILAISIVL